MGSPFILMALRTPVSNSVAKALEEMTDTPRPAFMPSLTAVDVPKRATARSASTLPESMEPRNFSKILRVPEPVSLRMKGSSYISSMTIASLVLHRCPTGTATTSSSCQSS